MLNEPALLVIDIDLWKEHGERSLREKTAKSWGRAKPPEGKKFHCWQGGNSIPATSSYPEIGASGSAYEWRSRKHWEQRSWGQGWKEPKVMMREPAGYRPSCFPERASHDKQQWRTNGAKIHTVTRLVLILKLKYSRLAKLCFSNCTAHLNSVW